VFQRLNQPVAPPFPKLHSTTTARSKSVMRQPRFRAEEATIDKNNQWNFSIYRIFSCFIGTVSLIFDFVVTIVSFWERINCKYLQLHSIVSWIISNVKYNSAPCFFSSSSASLVSLDVLLKWDKTI
jgi:hypothetical protein